MRRRPRCRVSLTSCSRGSVASAARASRALECAPFERHQQIPGLHAGAGRRRATIDTCHQRSALVVQAQGGGKLRRQFLQFQSQPAAGNLAVFPQLRGNLTHRTDRHCKADALRTAAAAVDGGVDADQFAGRIHQRAAGIARIDGRIGLDEVADRADARRFAANRPDHAQRHRLADAKRVADRQHQIADACLPVVTQRDGRHLRKVDAQQRQVGERIAADQPGVGAAPVAQRHLDFVRVGDDMVVGHDVAVPVEHHARAEARLQTLARHRRTTEEALEHRVVQQRVVRAGDDLGAVDVDHGWRGALHGRGEAVGCRFGARHRRGHGRRVACRWRRVSSGRGHSTLIAKPATRPKAAACSR